MSAEIDILDQLDAELSAFVSKSTLEARITETRKKSGNAQLPHERRLQLKRDLEDMQRQLEAINWSVVANVALFSETTCRHCGGSSTVFLQFMERLKTTAGPKVDRLSRIPVPHPNVANEVVIQAAEVDMCGDCCAERGFDILKAVVNYVNKPSMPRS